MQKRIVKETLLLASVQIIKLTLGLARTKLIAFYFGPAGIGILALYQAFVEMAQQTLGAGLDKASVKCIAGSNSDEEKQQFIRSFRYLTAFLAITFPALIAIVSPQISQWVFKSEDYSVGIVICALTLTFNFSAVYFTSILNATGAITRIARAQTIGIIVGNLSAISLIYFLRDDQLSVVLLTIAASAVAPLALAYRKRPLGTTQTPREIFKVALELLRNGFGFWIAGTCLVVSDFIIRQLLMERFGLSEVGLFQAAWTISNLFIGIILGSMAVSFFPKACAMLDDISGQREFLDKQIQFGLLLCLPILTTLITFNEELLALLYSEEFSAGSHMVTYQTIGVFMRLYGFPFGYILMAHGKVKAYAKSQLALAISNVCILYIIIETVGLSGVGINYSLCYALYAAYLYILCRKTINYRPSIQLIKTSCICLGFSFVAITINSYGVKGLNLALPLLIITLSGLFALWRLHEDLNLNPVTILTERWKR